MTEMLLETRALTMQFGGVRAVDGVDFALAEGELRCLIGPNGAGKSTFFKLITGQLRPSAGEVLYRGRPITGLEPHDIARLGMGIKTQVPNVFDGLSVRENLWLAARRRHVGRAADRSVEEQMDRLGLGALRERIVGQLAHGQRQWVELGVVLAAGPELVLLDEPAAGMTDDETRRTAELIGEINKTHALIVVEHDMQFIRAIARTVTVFNQGSVLVEGDVADVLRDPRVRDVYLGKKVAA
ncbi:MAG TPA: ATP-binding cassette domain-containing protein [Hyphomicrobiales bacterium]|nr:ATP-binding cassette domain-containing protein [Hyphomicrobiales bacterium]